MAMNVGNNSGSDEPEVMMEINTTPLIDVMLVLLVMLIITIPIQLHAVNIEMPVPAPQTVEKPETHKILIQKDGQIGVDGISVTAIELQQKMES
jgi:biopolymer transport protein ExbD